MTAADTTNCPRGDGGWLRRIDLGSAGANDPRESLPDRYRYECSTCSKWWHPVELKRPGVALKAPKQEPA